MPDDNSSELPTRTGSFRAVVRVGDTVVEYSRAGCGRPVVLLGLQSGAELKQELSRHFKLVVPESGATTESVDWLRCFLEGLGLTQVDVIAREPMVPLAVEFFRLEPDRVGKLVLLQSPGQPDSLDTLIQDPAAAHRLLLIPEGRSTGDPADQIVRFLLATTLE